MMDAAVRRKILVQRAQDVSHTEEGSGGNSPRGHHHRLAGAAVESHLVDAMYLTFTYPTT